MLFHWENTQQQQQQRHQHSEEEAKILFLFFSLALIEAIYFVLTKDESKM
jgi:uncharacterized membrane protein